MSQIRILQVVTHMERGGLESMLMNFYRHIDRNKVQFDFLVHRQEERLLMMKSNLLVEESIACLDWCLGAKTTCRR